MTGSENIALFATLPLHQDSVQHIAKMYRELKRKKKNTRVAALAFPVTSCLPLNSGAIIIQLESNAFIIHEHSGITHLHKTP